MRRRLSIGFAAIVAAAVTLSATPAYAAHAVLTYGQDGPAVAVGDSIGGPLKAGSVVRFSTAPGGATGATCTTSNFAATVVTNPPAGGTADLSVTAHNISNCTSNVFGVTCVQSVVVNNLPFNATINGTTKVVTIQGRDANTAPIRVTVRLCTFFGTITCVYQADNNTVIGLASNGPPGEISFINQRFVLVSGPSVCPPESYFTVTYSPITGPGGGVWVQ